MTIREDVSLQNLHTFRTPARAQYFAEVISKHEIAPLLQKKPIGIPILVLGGGSNLLFTKDFPGLVLLNRISGIRLTEETDSEVLVKAGGGLNWHDFVQFCLAKKWYGAENLSLIPGTVGAAPVQNIGAYGTELSEIFEEAEAIDLTDGRLFRFSKEDCRFGYRDSIFKNEYKDRYIITAVIFRLSKVAEVKTAYGNIRQELDKEGITDASPEDVGRAVIRIRQSKLPDPVKIGNAGSFFKNPQIPAQKYEELLQTYPDLPSYPGENGQVKIPAGKLIDLCGFKGQNRGSAGVHEQHALVLVNRDGQAQGFEIQAFANEIQQTVKEKFGLIIEPEVRII